MKKFLILFLTICIACILGCGIYINDYYPAIDVTLESSDITIEQQDNYTYFYSDNATTGLIFYPGGKVDALAYAPILEELAKQDIFCILAEMPFRLAVLNKNAADGIQEQFPNITTWYMAGHSLGGSMAASYLSEHTDAYKGLILLASYSTNDLSDTPLQVLSIYGSEDQVLNQESYQKYYNNLPTTTLEFCIQGGNHAQFGSYGIQKGDGTATITPEEQLQQTVQIILNFIESNEHQYGVFLFHIIDTMFFTRTCFWILPINIS